MKMRKSLLVVVVMLAMASLMAAMAFNSGYIHSSQRLSIVNTDNALVALVPGTGVGNLDATATVAPDGALSLDFGKGINGSYFGLQPGSSYVWNELFQVKSNTKEDIEYSFTLDSELAKYVTITDTNTNTIMYRPGQYNPGGAGYVWVRIASGTTHSLKFEISLNHGVPRTAGPTGNSVVLHMRAVGANPQ